MERTRAAAGGAVLPPARGPEAPPPAPPAVAAPVAPLPTTSTEFESASAAGRPKPEADKGPPPATGKGEGERQSRPNGLPRTPGHQTAKADSIKQETTAIETAGPSRSLALSTPSSSASSKSKLPDKTGKKKRKKDASKLLDPFRPQQCNF